MAAKKASKSSGAKGESPKSNAAKSSATRFNMEVTPADLVAFKKAAKAEGLTMSAWARITLRKASVR
jgi:hypothetical protein